MPKKKKLADMGIKLPANLQSLTEEDLRAIKRAIDRYQRDRQPGEPMLCTCCSSGS